MRIAPVLTCSETVETSCLPSPTSTHHGAESRAAHGSRWDEIWWMECLHSCFLVSKTKLSTRFPSPCLTSLKQQTQFEIMCTFPRCHKLLSEVIAVHVYMHAQKEHEPAALAGDCKPVEPHPVVPRVSRCKTDKPTAAHLNTAYVF